MGDGIESLGGGAFYSPLGIDVYGRGTPRVSELTDGGGQYYVELVDEYGCLTGFEPTIDEMQEALTKEGLENTLDDVYKSTQAQIEADVHAGYDELLLGKVTDTSRLTRTAGHLVRVFRPRNIIHSQEFQGALLVRNTGALHG